jgi:Na+/melibiose symporter-like transporter
MLYSFIPVVLLILLMVCVYFLGKLDKEMPHIEALLAKRKEEHAAE